jgi:hypothetical protein
VKVFVFPIMHSPSCITEHKGVRTDFNSFDWLKETYCLAQKQNALQNMWGALCKVRVHEVTKGYSTWIFMCSLHAFACRLNEEFVAIFCHHMFGAFVVLPLPGVDGALDKIKCAPQHTWHE